MILTVDHVTRYKYGKPVRGLVQSHRLTPTRFDGQTVLDWTVSVDGGVMGGAFRDGAGDLVQGWTVKGPVQDVVVRVKGRVSTSDLAGVLRGNRELTPPDTYLRESPLTVMSKALRELALAAETVPDTLSQAHELSRAVTQAMTYSSGQTDPATTAADALDLAAGVCQDFTHVLCTIARERGIPARYVSGYLWTGPDGDADQAAHAWAELYISGIGWIGFDAVNECCPDDRYIRLGSGLDAQEAAPIRGSSRSLAEEDLDVTVAVLATQQ